MCVCAFLLLSKDTKASFQYFKHEFASENELNQKEIRLNSKNSNQVL